MNRTSNDPILDRLVEKLDLVVREQVGESLADTMQRIRRLAVERRTSATGVVRGRNAAMDRARFYGASFGSETPHDPAVTAVVKSTPVGQVFQSVA